MSLTGKILEEALLGEDGAPCWVMPDGSVTTRNPEVVLFWKEWGPRLSYCLGTLYVSDLNPQIETRWRMSRTEMLALGWRCLIAAIRG